MANEIQLNLTFKLDPDCTTPKQAIEKITTALTSAGCVQKESSGGAIAPASAPAPKKLKDFNILCVGPPKSGKTTFIKRFCTGEFSSDYVPTKYETRYKATINTTLGMVDCTLWDIPFFGQISENISFDTVFVFHSLHDDSQLINAYLDNINVRSKIVQIIHICSFNDHRAAPVLCVNDYVDIRLSAYTNGGLYEPFYSIISKLFANAKIIANPPIKAN
jgi:hypothetical protein